MPGTGCNESSRENLGHCNDDYNGLSAPTRLRRFVNGKLQLNVAVLPVTEKACVLHF